MIRDYHIRSVAEYVKVLNDAADSMADELWYRGIGSLDYQLLPGLLWRENAFKHEDSLIHRFLSSYQSYGDFSSLNSWENYALMQHHGLPTRLLDWTENPLVAFYFALQGHTKKNADRVVWAMNPYLFNELNHDAGPSA